MPSDHTLGRPAQRRIVLCVVTMLTATIGACAARHESGKIQQTQTAEAVPTVKFDYSWLDSVSFDLYRCKRTHTDGSVQAFYMVGEVHIYNEPTSRYADSLLARLQPGLLLSEGSDSTLGRSDFMMRFSLAMRDLKGAIGRGEPELSRLARTRGIPVVFLEVLDSSTGVYTGVTPSEKAMLELVVASIENSNKAENNPVQRMMKYMLEHPEKMRELMQGMLEMYGIDTSSIKGLGLPQTGIIDTRNSLMSNRALEYIVPEYGCILIRFGMGHSDGMIEQLKAHNCDCEAQSLQEFLESGT